MPSIYHHSNQAKDRDRPKVVFLSNIPHKINACVAGLQLFQGGRKHEVVDLAASASSFDVTLDVNSLLRRNSRLTPTDLVRKNLIFVARTKRPVNRQCLFAARFPEVWQSILAKRSAHETFVACFHLVVAKFLVNLAHLDRTVLEFKQNAHLQTLHDCNPLVIAHVKGYVCRKIAAELKNIEEFSTHITSPAAILQNLPPAENISELEDVNSSCSIHLDPVQLVDVSFSDLDLSCHLEKQLVFAEDADFDASEDELRILPSDDSAKGTIQEDDDLDRLYSSEYLSCMDLTSVLDLDCLNSTSTAVLERASGANIDGGNVQPSKLEVLGAGFTAHSAKTPAKCSDFDNESGPLLGDVDARIALPRALFCRRTVSVGLLPKKPGILYIDHDEKDGLEYAFHNKSPEIPKYIKEDKKFKFIKIGKVQKFVNTFEQQNEAGVHERSASGGSSVGSRFGSRLGTRPASPGVTHNSS
ncbi:hypothetical protein METBISCDRAFT_26204 [Metschnikowia bicuspidata]|uniref:Uncharacterized protein n=1 Tax=Metschnikowia bicuspidata TaxID=27322 RepID=A0A4P9ZHV8_9ASCO|nr:hypothetical protein METBISCDRAFT_26204 [Metschnikowia bicuspidata]